MALADFLDRIGTAISNAPPESWYALSQGLGGNRNFGLGLAQGLNGFGAQYQAAQKKKSLADALQGAMSQFTPQQQQFIGALEPDQAVPILGKELFRQPQQGPFQGESVPAQAMNFVVRGQRDPTVRATPEYAAAWQQLYGKPQLVPGPTGELVPVMISPPQGFIAPGAGAAQATAGGGAGRPTVGAPLAGTAPPPNNEQVLSQGFASRLDAANKILSQPNITASVADPMNRVGNAILGNYGVSSNYQQGDQAQRDFINAQLRRESGAVISPSEFDNAKQQYFPQPNDGPAVLQQKADARQRAIDNMKLGARPGSVPPPAQKPNPGQETPVQLPPRGQEPVQGQLYQTSRGAAVYLGNGQFQAAQ